MNTESTVGFGVGWEVGIRVMEVEVGTAVGVGTGVAEGDTDTAVGTTSVAVAEALHATTNIAKIPSEIKITDLNPNISLDSLLS